MLETIVQGRQTGKTTKAIKMMMDDKYAILVIPFASMIKQYPKHLQSRIVSGHDILDDKLRGRKFSVLILDEGFSYDELMLSKMYYYFGYNHMDVIALGSIYE